MTKSHRNVRPEYNFLKPVISDHTSHKTFFFEKKSGHQELVLLSKQFGATVPS